MDKRLQYLAGLIKEEDVFNPFAEEFESHEIKQKLVNNIRTILAKHNVPEDSKFNFDNLRNHTTVVENASLEEAVNAFLKVVRSKFASNEDWITAVNDQAEEDWLDDQRTNANLTDDEYADFEPDYEMDEDELIHNTEELVEDLIDDNVDRDHKWTSWGVMFYGLTRKIGSFSWRVEKPQ